MQNEKITILFIISTARTNQRGLCPVNCRITLNKERKQLNTGLLVNPTYWESKLQKVTILEPNHKYINAQLERIQVKMYSIVLVFQLQGIPFNLH
jgi:integrase/recombinase XerD